MDKSESYNKFLKVQAKVDDAFELMNIKVEKVLEDMNQSVDTCDHIENSVTSHSKFTQTTSKSYRLKTKCETYCYRFILAVMLILLFFSIINAIWSAF